jgi:hypothetical protein
MIALAWKEGKPMYAIVDRIQQHTPDVHQPVLVPKVCASHSRNDHKMFVHANRSMINAITSKIVELADAMDMPGYDLSVDKDEMSHQVAQFLFKTSQ